MKFLIKLIFILSILGGGGYFAYRYFMEDGEIPFFEPPWPEELIQLQDSVGVEVNNNGTTVITANTRSDIAFMQGFVHGKSAPEQLDTLRKLFRGERSPDLPKHLTGLAELFFYLDLDHVAQASKQLYPAQLQVLLQSYAEGITQGAKFEKPWTFTDVLLYHRGIAFLQGRNFVKEWASFQLTLKFGKDLMDACVGYEESNYGALSEGFALQAGLAGICQKPLFETVRLYDGKKLLGSQTRIQPYFKFLYTPMILELSNTYRAKGISITGIPFLQSAKNGHLTFHRQPILGNDEQFRSAPRTSFLEQEPGYFANTIAGKAFDYPEPPIHTRLGRKVSNLVGGGKRETNYFYHWDGFRPSADLAALYYLLEARDPDEALAAYQYHQIPATELTIATSSGHTINARVLSSDPVNEQSIDPRLFAGPVTKIGTQLHSIRGIHGKSERPWNITKSDKTGISELDQRLTALMRFYLKGPIRDEHLDPLRQQQIMARLNDDKSVEHFFFIHQLWEVSNRLLAREYFPGESGELALRIMGQESKHLFLAIYGRRGPNANRQGETSTRAKVIAGLLSAAYGDEDGNPIWLVEDPRGRTSKEKLNFAAPSADVGTGVFFIEKGNRVTQMATYTFAWGNGFQFWRYDFAKKNSIGPSKRIARPGQTEKMVFIQPKI